MIGEGPNDGLLIVDHGPSSTDEGRVFTSKSGHLLRKWIAEIGLSDKVRFEYFDYDRAAQNFNPGGLSTAGLKKLDNFKRRLLEIRPKVVLLLDRKLNRLLDTNHCYVIRSHPWFNCPVVPSYSPRDCYIPVPGVASDDTDDDLLFEVETPKVAALRQFWIKVALAKAKALLIDPRQKLPAFLLSNSFKDIITYLDRCDKAKYFVCDIETVNKPNWVLSAIGFACDTATAVSVTPDIGEAEWTEILTRVRQILMNPAIEKVGQNWIGFDQFVLHRNYGMSIRGPIWDTMDSFNLLYPNFKRGLADQARLWLDIEPWKGHHETQGEMLRLYNAKDIHVTALLYEQHKRELVAIGQLDHFKTYIQPVVNLAFEMQIRGLTVDTAHRETLIKTSNESLDILLTQLSEAVGDALPHGLKKDNKRDPASDVRINVEVGEADTQKMKRAEIESIIKEKLTVTPKELKEYYLAKKGDATKYGLVAGSIYKKSYKTELTPVKRVFNPDSPVQLKDLFAVWGIKLPKTKKAKKKWGESTNVKALLKLRRMATTPKRVVDFCNLLLAYRKCSKVISTYLNATLDADSKWRCSYSVSGTATGRSSTRKTPFETGGNIQNIPRVGTIGLKSMFVPSAPGKLLMQIDQSQAELRIVAYLAECVKLIELLETGQDAHVYMASMFTGEDITKYKATEPAKYKYLRHCGKGCNHSGNYAVGPTTMSDIFLVQGVYVSAAECAAMIEKRKEIFPEIYDVFQGGVIAQLNRDRTLVTPFGRKRKFIAPLDENTYREAFAYVPQSTVPYLTNLLWRKLATLASVKPQLGLAVLQMGHDSLLLELNSTESVIGEVKKFIVSETQNMKFTIGNRQIAMPWDFSIGQTWGDLS